MKEYRFILAGYTRRSNKGVHILNISLDKPEIDGLNSKDTIGILTSGTIVDCY